MQDIVTRRRHHRLLPALLLAALLGCTAEQVSVRTDPPGAKIYWDNTYVGDSPLTFNPPLNREAIFEEVHIVEAVREGYMTGLGYVAERGGGGGLINPQVNIVLHEAPEWYVSQADAAATAGADTAGLSDRDAAAAERAGITVRDAIDAIDRIACDIRVVRVCDGRVMYTTYGLTGPQRMIILAEQLAEQFRRDLPPEVQGSAVMVRLRNRRRSAEGEELAGELSKMLFRELVYTGRLRLSEMIDVRDLVEPRMLDHSQIVTNPDVKKKLGGAEYIIQGGIAESRDPRVAGVILDYNREDEKNEKDEKK